MQTQKRLFISNYKQKNMLLPLKNFITYNFRRIVRGININYRNKINNVSELMFPRGRTLSHAFYDNGYFISHNFTHHTKMLSKILKMIEKFSNLFLHIFISLFVLF